MLTMGTGLMVTPSTMMIAMLRRWMMMVMIMVMMMMMVMVMMIAMICRWTKTDRRQFATAQIQTAW